jgi:hypothetical protein
MKKLKYDWTKIMELTLPILCTPKTMDSTEDRKKLQTNQMFVYFFSVLISELKEFIMPAVNFNHRRNL